MKKITAICKAAVAVFMLVLLFVGCPSPVQPEIELTSIQITKKPNKLTYYTTDTFDPAGLVVTAVYSDGTTNEITDYTTDGQTALQTVGERTVTVSYAEKEITKTATFTITVTIRPPQNLPSENPGADTTDPETPPSENPDSGNPNPESPPAPVTLTSIDVTTLPEKLSYYTSDTFTSAGLTITATYSDGSTRLVSDWTTNGVEVIKISGAERKVIVSYTEGGVTKTAAFTVNVHSLVSIEVTTLPATLSYYTSDTFNATGLTITASYNNGSTRIVTGWTTDGTDVIKTPGKNEIVTVSYSEGGITRITTFAVQVAYAFYDTVIRLPTGTTGSNGTTSSYVYFGDWPQTIKDSSVTVDETQSIERGGNIYYLGSDGYYYAKCLESAYSSDSQYKYTNGTQVNKSSSESFAWFKVEPIKWRVLDADFNAPGNTLLLAENILAANVPYYESTSKHRNGSYANNYKDSQIRAYLNGISYNAASSSDENKWLNVGFLQSAFTEKAQNLIVTTTVDNSAASTTDIGDNITQATEYVCENTQDKVFLLSEYEVTKYSKESYNSFGLGTGRIRKPTDYALANYCFQSSTSVYGGYWWLRSPNYTNYSYSARYVNGDGVAYLNFIVSSSYYGVVPALVVAW